MSNITGMFIIGFVIFVGYIYALLRAITWGHKSQEEETIKERKND